MPTRRPVKKPSKYTERRIEQILTALKSLSGRVASAESAGIDYHTFKIWYEDIPEFRARVNEAELETMQRGKEVAIKAIFRAMEKSWQSAAWWLERNHPDQYGRIERVDMNMNSNQIIFTIGNSTEPEQIEDVTNDILKITNVNEEKDQGNQTI